MWLVAIFIMHKKSVYVIMLSISLSLHQNILIDWGYLSLIHGRIFKYYFSGYWKGKIWKASDPCFGGLLTPPHPQPSFIDFHQEEEIRSLRFPLWFFSAFKIRPRVTDKYRLRFRGTAQALKFFFKKYLWWGSFECSLSFLKKDPGEIKVPLREDWRSCCVLL